MMKSAALLLLLAVAASQADQHMAPAVEEDISACPITYYGRTFNRTQVFYDNTAVMICFTDAPGKSSKDCLFIRAQHDVVNISAMIQSHTMNLGSPVHQALPNIRSNSTCLVHIAYAQNQTNNTIFVQIHNFGAQAVVNIDRRNATQPNVTVEAQVADSSLGIWKFSNSQLNQRIFLDISGCRISGATLAANTTALDPKICSKIMCDASAVLSTVSTCGPKEHCHGNNRCVPTLGVCTVTGSTVIGYFGNVLPVPDRCQYTLMKPLRSSAFGLVASFQERRRKDVIFLDHLILSLDTPGVKIYLEQGGRVRVDDEILTLSTTVQVVHGVALSQDHTGVTARIPFSGARISVFFDGYTAHVTARNKDSLEGLCGNPNNPSMLTSLVSAKSSSSAAGCNKQYPDIVDKAINCSRTTDHCDLMSQAPFTACHNHIDPEPYITACTNTLCKYPAVDGLKCQFLEAYTKACSEKTYPIMQDWRSPTGCSAVPQAFCPNQTCSAHEFCGEKPFGGTRCFCRAIFASKYKSTNTLGEPTVCMESSATVTLAGCLMEDKGIDYNVLHLNDESCKGEMDNKTHMVTFKFDSSNTCGTEVTMTNTQIIYKNIIKSTNMSMNSIITRHNQIQIDFSCFYRKPDVKTVAFRIKDSSVVQRIVSGAWNYTLRMNAYTNPARTKFVGSNTEISLNQKVWLELKTEELDDKLVSLVTDACWATNQPSPSGSLRYDLIMNGCPNPADPTVTVESNGLGTSNYFSFNMFEFSGQNNEIYLHCKLELCIKQDRPCSPSCSQSSRRRRRSLRSEDAAFISMAWAK